MSKTTKIGLGLAGAIVIAAAGYFLIMHPRTYVVDGTITWLNMDLRQAGMQFKHPTKGLLRDKVVTIPPDCQIALNDRPAKLEDVHVGDRAVVTACYRRATKEYRLVSVAVSRQNGSPSSAPATQTAGS